MRPRISLRWAVPPCAVEHEDLTLLDLAHAGDERQQRRFADAIRPDHADHDARRNVDAQVVEGKPCAVSVRYAIEFADDGLCHCGSFVTRSSGHVAVVLVRTSPCRAHRSSPAGKIAAGP